MHSLLVATFSEREGPKILVRCHEGGPGDATAPANVWYSTLVAGDGDDGGFVDDGQPRCFHSVPGDGGDAASPLLRSLCLRALCVEHVGPEREGRVLFGQHGRLFTLTYVFQLLDRRARGMHRSFAFIYTHPSLAMLVGNAQYLDVLLRDFAATLKRCAKLTFQADAYLRLSAARHEAGTLHLTASSSPSSAAQQQQKPRHQRTSSTGGWPDVAATAAAAAAPAELRSLSELLNKPLIVKELHVKLSYALYSCRGRLVKRGPPPGVGGGAVFPGRQAQVQAVEEREPVGHRPLTLHDVKSALAAGPGGAAYDRRSEIERIEPADAFRTLLFHLASGDQVIVTADEDSVAASVVTLLSTVLPEPLRKVLPLSDEYVQGYACNLLGLPQQVFQNGVLGSLDPGCVHIAFGRCVRGTAVPKRGVLTRNAARWGGRRVSDAQYPRDLDMLAAMASPSEESQLLRLQMKFWRQAVLFSSYVRATRSQRTAMGLTHNERKRYLSLVCVNSANPAADAAVFLFLGSAGSKMMRDAAAAAATGP